jgi:lipoprotein-releasing system permease protein
VTSVINGFEGELTRVITGVNGDVILYSREPIPDYERVEAKIRKVLPETRAITHSFVTELMASSANGVAGAILEGIDTKTLGDVTAVPERMVAGRLPNAEGEVALGSSLAERLGATEESEIRLVVPFVVSDVGGGKLSGAPKILKAKVVGIVRMGMFEYDSKLTFATLSTVQTFLEQPGKITSFKIKLPPGADSRAASDRLADNFGFPYRSKDWAQLYKNLYYAIRLEKAVIAIILTVIVIVAAFNVVSTLMMMIHDKTKEIAILKAMGFRKAQSFRLFCLIGIGMGVVGTAIGVGMGLGLNWVLERTRLIELPTDIYHIGFLPVVVRWAEIGIIVLVALLISLFATFYPAWKVSNSSPLEGLRYD